jgi:anaerobic selenocysteine-containing dehydrogenase
LRKAFEQLEVLVVIDLYRNATAEYAHWVLPATDMYERDDLNIVNIGTSHQPFVQYTPAVVEPAGERRPEWWIVGRMLQALGKPSVFDTDPVDPWAKWRHMLAKGSGVELAELQSGDPVRVLPAPAPGRFFDDCITTLDGLVDCRPAVFDAAIERCESLFAEAAADAARPVADRPLTLIHKRDAWMHNSWMGNLPRMKRAGRDTNPLFLNPADAARLGIAAGDPVRVWNDYGEVVAPAGIDPELLDGVVAMVHGWGQAATPGMQVAQRTPGVNVNALLPIGDGSYEPLSSQAHMTGVRVHVAPAPAFDPNGPVPAGAAS